MKLLRKMITWTLIEIEMFWRWFGESLWWAVRHPFRTSGMLLKGLCLVIGRATEVVLVFSVIDGLSNRR